MSHTWHKSRMCISQRLPPHSSALSQCIFNSTWMILLIISHGLESLSSASWLPAYLHCMHGSHTTALHLMATNQRPFCLVPVNAISHLSTLLPLLVLKYHQSITILGITLGSMLSLHFAWVINDAKCIAVTSVCVCVCVCLYAATCLHYCTDPDVTWGSGRGCPLVVHYRAHLHLVHGLNRYGNTRNAWQSPVVIARPNARCLHYACRRRLPSPAIKLMRMHDVMCNEALPFRPHCGGVVMWMRNVSEYMLVLALCLVKEAHLLHLYFHEGIKTLLSLICWRYSSTVVVTFAHSVMTGLCKLLSTQNFYHKHH